MNTYNKYNQELKKLINILKKLVNNGKKSYKMFV